MKHSHWFYKIQSDFENGFRILTYALGDHPVGSHWFETEVEREAFAKELLAEDYEFMKSP